MSHFEKEIDQQRWAVRRWLCDVWLCRDRDLDVVGGTYMLSYYLQHMNAAWMKLYKIFDGTD
jgi:ribosomal protein L37AE/L43A